MARNQIQGPSGNIFDPAADGGVTLSGSNAKQSGRYARSGVLGAGVTETLLDIAGHPCQVDALAWASSDPNIEIGIRPYDEAGVLAAQDFQIPGTDGFVYTPSAEVLQNLSGGENDFFRNFQYDATLMQFSSGIKRNIPANNGVRITVTNPNGVGHNVSVTAWVSEWN